MTEAQMFLNELATRRDWLIRLKHASDTQGTLITLAEESGFLCSLEELLEAADQMNLQHEKELSLLTDTFAKWIKTHA